MGTSSVLAASSSNWTPGKVMRVQKTPDYLAFASYIAATGVQFSLIITILHLIQIKIIPLLVIPQPLLDKVPAVIKSLQLAPLKSFFVWFLMAFFSVRSRIFSPLDNSRPNADKNDTVFKDRLRPSWQPPPIAFPIIWSNIALLRAISATIIFNTTGTLLCNPLFAFMFHLSCGDTWNTINNVEGRLGTAALIVPSVLITAAYTTFQYYQVRPLAAKLLSPSVLWLLIANCLVFTIFKINNTGRKYALFPAKGESFRCKWRMPLLTRKTEVNRL